MISFPGTDEIKTCRPSSRRLRMLLLPKKVRKEKAADEEHVLTYTQASLVGPVSGRWDPMAARDVFR